MAPTGLEVLPKELLYMVLGYLGVDHHLKSRVETSLAYLQHNKQQTGDKPSWYSLECQTLSTLCLVSRPLRHAVGPILYREFMPGYGDSALSTHYSWRGRLTTFMRTVAERRDLAAHVKRIYVHPYLLKRLEREDVRAAASGEEWEPTSEEIEERAAPAAALQTVADALKITDDLQQLSVYDLISVLVAALPNLEHCSLQIANQPVRETAHRHSQGLRCVTEIPPRPVLKTLDIAACGVATDIRILYYLDWWACALLKACPNLETLTLYRCAGILTQDVEIPSLARLKTLHITRSNLGQADLEALVARCGSLRSFVYEADRVGLPWESNHPLQGPGDASRTFHTAQSLRRHHETLESIYIDIRLRRNLVGGDHLDPFSFRDFHVLQRLSLNFTAFADLAWGQEAVSSDEIVQFLPQSIVFLHLASGSDPVNRTRMQDGLLGLAEAASQGKFPKLREVRYCEENRLDGRSTLSRAFAAAGVNLIDDRWSAVGQTQQPPPEVHCDHLGFYNYRDSPAAQLPIPDEDPDL